jgi:hypothetical protein
MRAARGRHELEIVRMPLDVIPHRRACRDHFQALGLDGIQRCADQLGGQSATPKPWVDLGVHKSNLTRMASILKEAGKLPLQPYLKALLALVVADHELHATRVAGIENDRTVNQPTEGSLQAATGSVVATSASWRKPLSRTSSSANTAPTNAIPLPTSRMLEKPWANPSRAA